MFSSSPLDWGLILVYFAFLAAVWVQRLGTRSTALEYLVAGRRVTLPAFVATLVATWYGGILGVGEYSWRYGLSNWLVFGVPYYIGALLFAWSFARRAREAALYTIPDLLDRHYGRGPALLGALTVFVTSTPAAYVLMLGTLFAAMLGLPLVPCVIAAAALSLFYIDRGGLRTVVFTDQVQFVLMYTGFIVMLAFLVARHGGIGFLGRELPATHLTWHGGNPPEAILVWYFIALSTLVDPGFWQRAYAARDPGVARNGVLISVGCWMVFDFLTTTTGLYARALLPQLPDPVYAFPELARITLPPVALGLFYLAMIATVMSTVDSYGFIAAGTFGRDLIWRLRREQGEDRLPFYTRIGLAVSAVFACALALANPSVIGLWHDIGSITTPAMLLPVGTALLGRGRVGPRWTAAAMVMAFGVSLAWVLVEAFPPTGWAGGYPLSIEPIYAGLAVSLATYSAAWAIPSRAGRAGAGGELPMKTLVLVSALAIVPAVARAQDSTAAEPETLTRVVRLPAIEVSTTRGGVYAPGAGSSLDRAEVERRNWGQDTPMALATLPGAYAYSDAGNGIGYSYLTIRGFPQRRISVLVNGVPLNDPESHEVYWIDHPDLLASTSQVLLQRGVGSALYGAASVGGSVNLVTSPFTRERRASAAFTYGSFDTRRFVVEMNSGNLSLTQAEMARGDHWNFYGRYSRIETDGYRDQSWSRLWSYMFSARRNAGANSLRVNLYGGPEETHLAYLGVPRDYLDGTITGDRDRDRRFNPITYPGEADHFFEPHYELIHSWRPRSEVAITQTLFYFDGDGFYDERRTAQPLTDYRLTPWATFDPTLFGSDSLAYYANDGAALTRDGQGRVTVQNFDLVRRRRVTNRHYGWIPRVMLGRPRASLTLGGELRWHDGRHVGTVTSGNGLPPGTAPDHAYYDYHPRTFSAGLFARQEWRPVPYLTATVDVAWRHQDYFMRGDRFDGIRFDQDYDFALPRLAVTLSERGPWMLFAAYSRGRREPAFRDLYDAEGAGSVPLFAGGKPLIRPERVDDFEAGGRWWHGGLIAQLNLFRMAFRDELVYAGQFNTDLGYPILGNAAQSVHQGIEMEASWGFGAPFLGRRNPSPHVFGSGRERELELSANATLSDNHFVRYREIYGTSPDDMVVYDGRAIGFFPSVMANLSARAGTRGATLGAEVQHVGRMYLDQSESKEGSIAPRAVLNLAAGYRRGLPRDDGGGEAASPAVEVSLRLLNVLDRRYETGGYSYLYAGTRYTDFIPAATRNALAQVRIEF